MISPGMGGTVLEPGRATVFTILFWKVEEHVLTCSTKDSKLTGSIYEIVENKSSKAESEICYKEKNEVTLNWLCL